ncbi:MAG TPA: DNA polymerase III subunit delta [Burkholderiaceae bacterium]|nr:DNA polymerase III subunit delta [Burkholderiaceae bacterium]
MQVRSDQLAAHLAKGLARVYTIHGDEPLLAQEAADAIRAAARAAGHTERQVHTVAGQHFDWSSLIGASQAMSLFADRQLIEIRIPSGKPGKDGSDALQRYCAALADEIVTLVVLPRLDRTQTASAWFGALDAAGVTLRVDPVERAALPQWIAQRLARQGQRVQGGEAGQRALAFFADRVEGNLLAAHQEIVKLGLLYGADGAELSFERIEAAVLDVARYDVFKFGEAVLAGHAPRTLRMLDGLQAEGTAAVLVHYTLAGDILALKRTRDAVAAGRPLPLALRENRIWGARERLFERVLPHLTAAGVDELVVATQVCDGLVKGLKHPAWPDDPWDALRRLALMVCERAAAAPTRRPGGDKGLRLALTA